jgi:RND family efflux transporter MFP subunit
MFKVKEMKVKYSKIISLVFFASLTAIPVWGLKVPKDIPPAKVQISTVETGQISPTAEYVGTIYYQEVSEIASELSGLAEIVKFQEGDRIKKGQVLVKLRSDLLEKRIQATRSSYEQILPELERERLNLSRLKKLYKQNSISEQQYDETRFGLKAMEKQADALKAQVERLELELTKKIIRAPFGGIILKRHVDTGEWLAEGAGVAVLAKDDFVDVVAEVPEKVIRNVKKGLKVRIRVNGDELTGTVFAIIPRGDIATRTFPVKIRARNTLSLIEGMAARVSLPNGFRQNTLLVPRDAVIPVFGRTVVFAIVDSKAKMIPVSIVGYQGMHTGVQADTLKPGMKIVVKGNERLRDGQLVAAAELKG